MYVHICISTALTDTDYYQAAESLIYIYISWIKDYSSLKLYDFVERPESSFFERRLGCKGEYDAEAYD